MAEQMNKAESTGMAETIRMAESTGRAETMCMAEFPFQFFDSTDCQPGNSQAGKSLLIVGIRRFPRRFQWGSGK